MAICRARASLSLLKTKSPFFQYVPLHGFSSSQFSSQFEVTLLACLSVV
ncbi:hypothetical protein OIU79_026210 [Salix purpurea]|uniref:Uncharacterized protein n=1 Tax=Salix purpurea TaxID=77065 RepID=A0A9Q1A027_SALPP|nr:hypothetical protein OIU79_026210 [Salix purpurea]